MRVSRLIRTAWRMEGIPEQHEPCRRQLRILGGDVRRDAAAHRLAADEERAGWFRQFAPDRVDDAAIAGVEHRPSIRRSFSGFCVEKVERDDVETKGAEGTSEADYPRAALIRAGAVRQNQRGADAVRSSRIDERRGVSTRLDGDAE